MHYFWYLTFFFPEYCSKCDLIATQKLLYHLLYGDFFLQYLSCLPCVLLRKLSSFITVQQRPSTMNLRVRAESSHTNVQSVCQTHVPLSFFKCSHNWWPFLSYFPSLPFVWLPAFGSSSCWVEMNNNPQCHSPQRNVFLNLKQGISFLFL